MPREKNDYCKSAAHGIGRQCDASHQHYVQKTDYGILAVVHRSRHRRRQQQQDWFTLRDGFQEVQYQNGKRRSRSIYTKGSFLRED